MDLLLPDVRLAGILPRLIDATARFTSPLSGAVRTVARPGDRWGFRLDYQSLDKSQDRARMETLIAHQRGAANRVVFSPAIPPRGFVQRGSWATPELVLNGDFSAGTANWTASSATFTVADKLARVQNSTTSISRISSSAQMTLVIGAAYVARILMLPGNQANWAVYGGTTAGATDVFSITPAAPGYAAHGWLAGSTPLYLSLVCNSAVAGDFVTFAMASVTRCALVNGANQTGSLLKIDALPISTNGLLLPGDWIGVGLELKRVTAALNSDGSGVGWLQFSPPLRETPADNDPVIIASPMGRFLLSASETGWQIEPGFFSTLSLDFVEAP